MLLLVTTALPFSKTLVTPDERAQLAEYIAQLIARWNTYWSVPVEPTEPTHAI